jgi:ferric-dicitrate binding protein FerR (iron transport regulator)
MGKNTDIEALAAEYLSESISAEELDTLKTWLAASPENRKWFLTMREIWFSSAVASSDDEGLLDRDKAFQRFLVRKSAAEIARRRHSRRIWWQAAAAAAVLVGVSYTSFRQGGEQVKSRFANIEVEAPLGSRTKTYLPDGTLVWLNAGSKITYSQGFGVSDRKVKLSGEGYFEVVRNEELPFGVKTDELLVDVLGTKFNFRNYPDDKEASVGLLEGKVLASNNLKKGEQAELLPNQQVFLNKESGDMRIAKASALHTAEWTGGYLFFDEVLLPDIAKELERSYNVSITITHPDLEQLRFYGSFVRKEMSINEVLDMLASTGKIRYSIEGRNISLCLK